MHAIQGFEKLRVPKEFSMLVTIRRALYSPCNLDSLTRLTIEAQLDLSYRYFVYIRASIKKLNLFKKKDKMQAVQHSEPYLWLENSNRHIFHRGTNIKIGRFSL